MTTHKKFLIALIAAFLFISCGNVAFARDYYSTFKNSLIVQAGEKTLHFELPEGKCFIDASTKLGKTVFNSAGENGQNYIHKFLLAVFADCNELMKLQSTIDIQSVLNNSGSIYWLYPVVGENLDISREEYLKTFENPDIKEKDSKLHKNKSNIAFQSKQTIRTPYDTFSVFTTRANTLIKGAPLEFVFSTSAKTFNEEQIYKEADNFIQLQIDLNE